MAKLHFRYSAMNSGKTTELLLVADNYEFRKKNVLVIKPGVDTKGSEKVVARLGLERHVDILVHPNDRISDVLSPVVDKKRINCVLVDEAQFLQPDQVDALYWEISQDRNVPVIAYGLRADFLSKPFPGSERLMSLADELEEMYTLCKCGKKARFNARFSNGKIVFEGEQVAIDGEGVTYDSLCKNCYRKEFLKKTNSKKQKLIHATSKT